MKFRLLIFYFFYFFLYTLNVGSYSFAAEEYPIVDFHVHDQDDESQNAIKAIGLNFPGFDELLKDPFFKSFYKHAMLISDSYLPSSFSVSDSCDTQPLNDFSSTNEKVSKAIQMDPAKLNGICGVDLRTADYLEKTSKCLAMPGFLGIKLHFSLSNVFISPELSKDGRIPKRFKEVAELVGKAKKMMLIHFNTPSGETFALRSGDMFDADKMAKNFDKAEVDTLMQVATEYPNAKFIIAHSGFGQSIGLAGLKIIGNYYRTHPEVPQNIYTDTSATDFGSTDFDLKLSEAWKAFGVKRVIFGSDFPTRDIQQAVNGIKNNNFLSGYEKQMILSENGSVLVEALRQDVSK
jgi:predicted TIM-barrel fold metal-dependent hydrolase